MNTITKNGIQYKILYMVKARNTAPFVHWGCPEQNVNNHKNDIKYKTVQAESQEYSPFRLYHKQSEHNPQKWHHMQDIVSDEIQQNSPCRALRLS